uniref:Uncharacterized protein n=1 Tax=Nannospalax galili TaxID=1026970 RepID=A0A8C6RCD6_NANGA
MESVKKMDVINITALPLVPLNEHLVVSFNARKALESAMRKELEEHPPTFLIGSLRQVNQKITEIDLGPSLWTSTLVSHRTGAEARPSERWGPGESHWGLSVYPKACLNN